MKTRTSWPELAEYGPAGRRHVRQAAGLGERRHLGGGEADSQGSMVRQITVPGWTVAWAGTTMMPPRMK